MSLTASAPEGGDFELTPAGTHVATCYLLADIGLQKSSFNGEEKIQRKVVLTFELPNELMEDGRPFAISAYWTNSLSENANLRKNLQAWRGKAFTDDELKGFDLRNVLGKPCMIGVQHEENNGKTYANISSISPLVKGMAAPEAINEIVAYDMDQHDDIVFQKLPKWIQEKITNAEESYRGNESENPAPAEDFDDDIPFAWAVILPLIPILGMASGSVPLV